MRISTAHSSLRQAFCAFEQVEQACKNNKRGGGTAICINQRWCSSPKQSFVYAKNNIEATAATRTTKVSSTSQISSANATSKRPPTLQRGFLLTVSTPCMRNYQRQGHTPPPGAVLNCFPRRLQPIVNMFYQHCHGCWLTATLN